MKQINKSVLTTVIAALVAALVVSGLAVAANEASTAKSKSKFTKAQRKEINKLITAKVKAATKKSDTKIAAVDAKAATAAAGPIAYSAKNTAPSANLPSDYDIETTVLQQNLPAGKYVVSGRVRGSISADGQTDRTGFRCKVRDSSGTLLEDMFGAAEHDQLVVIVFGNWINLPLSFTVDAPTGTTLTVKCAAGKSDSSSTAIVAAGDARLNSVQVRAVN
jgi:hypothetical protein